MLDCDWALTAEPQEATASMEEGSSAKWEMWIRVKSNNTIPSPSQPKSIVKTIEDTIHIPSSHYCMPAPQEEGGSRQWGKTDLPPKLESTLELHHRTEARAAAAAAAAAAGKGGQSKLWSSARESIRVDIGKEGQPCHTTPAAEWGGTGNCVLLRGGEKGEKRTLGGVGKKGRFCGTREGRGIQLAYIATKYMLVSPGGKKI
ncbi:uncharacterized protein LOC115094695 [Rhinatrema bivittatum]|uniref:uncharacterized protein LOC115094695 n=1 Tax=Rhinatrema bivittatum TaxID=194408 RepID=UPI00112B4ECC|nr:uncharacterized protein LOC115094695 [Rhinatrema bivittatum]